MSKKIDFLKSVHSMSDSDLKSRITEDEMRLKKLRMVMGFSKGEMV